MKSVCVAALVLLASSPLFGQSLYFDVGLGVGSAVTQFDGEDVASAYGSGVDEVAIAPSFKLGVGPVVDPKLYLVVEWGGIGHRFDDGYSFVQYNSYLVGPGIIYYPTPLVQVGVSAGYSYTANTTDLPAEFYESTGGYAVSASVALDLGDASSGLLFGAKYILANNTIEVINVQESSSILSLFVGYAWREKQTDFFD